MLKESYIANWKNLPVNAVKIRVARPSILSPSKELFSDYKQGKMEWEDYEKRFRNEILNSKEAMDALRDISELSKGPDVYLICYEKNYPCHRFILIDMIKELRLPVCEYRIRGLTGNGIGGCVRVWECTRWREARLGHRNANCLCIMEAGKCPQGLKKIS